MPQNISKKSLKRHREVVANSFFPYISKSLGASVPREPHLLSPLHPDARRTGGAGTKTARQSPLQHIIPPTEPCNPLRLEQLELETRTLLSNRANAEKQESLLPQPGVDRMPSTTENSLDPEVWTIKERNVLLEDDEARLLGNFGYASFVLQRYVLKGVGEIMMMLQFLLVGPQLAPCSNLRSRYSSISTKFPSLKSYCIRSLLEAQSRRTPCTAVSKPNDRSFIKPLGVS